ncbi:hypothetical protein SK128_022597 [Halocaridina rubra]|uniref:Uncharacterized protein n=1 Tax=Halocaridina rubra TaxID=373956 RepID=A0AAN9ADK7_HALRR
MKAGPPIFVTRAEGISLCDHPAKETCTSMGEAIFVHSSKETSVAWCLGTFYLSRDPKAPGNSETPSCKVILVSDDSHSA